MEETEKALRARKTVLLDKIESRVNAKVKSTGKNCIAVVERNKDGTIHYTWDFTNDIDDLCKAIYLFLRKKKSKSGRDFDSALTDPILEIVTDEYEEFYKSESGNISKGVLTALGSDEVKLGSFVDRISNIALQKISKQAKKKVVDLVVHEVKESISQGTLHTVGQQVQHIAATTAGTQAAAFVAHFLIKLLATHIVAIVSQILASAAIQHALMALLKHFVLGLVTTAVFQFLTVHFGAALAGTSVLWVVIPILAGYMAWKIATFPEDLGKALSKEVRAEVAKNFDSMNKTILEKIFDAVFEGNKLADAISKDEGFRDALRKLGESME